MEIPKQILKEIKEFCKLNKIKDRDKFILSILQIGFNVEKYGNAPWELEVKEIIKEVQVEKIIEKEVIKEVTVEKEVFITDDKKMRELGKELYNLKEKIRDKEGVVIKNAQNMKSLNTEIENKKVEITNLTDKLKKVNEDLSKVNKNLPPHQFDFYGDDGKGGHWGSNLKDKK